MPGIAIHIDGTHLATVNFAGMEMADVSVHSGLDKESPATLQAATGNFQEGGCGYLIWVNDMKLQSGQVLGLKFMEACETEDSGKTIQELYPDEPQSEPTDFSMTDAMTAELRARPRLRESFTVAAGTSSGQLVTTSSDETNTDFTFRVFWDATRPDQARVSLRTHCLDDVVARRLGPEHLHGSLAIGESASFTLLS